MITYCISSTLTGKDSLVKVLHSLENNSHITSVLIPKQYEELVDQIKNKPYTLSTVLDKNDALDKFVDTDSRFICFSTDNIRYEKFSLRGHSTLNETFLGSYAATKNPIQSVFIGSMSYSSILGENDYLYFTTEPHVDCYFVSRKAVEAVGYFDSNIPTYDDMLWQSRITAIAGRCPEEYSVLKHSYRYARVLDRTPKEPNKLYLGKYKDRMDEIYKGYNLAISSKPKC